MSELESNVVPLGKATQSDRKSAWLDQVAQGWDKFVDKHGHEPEAMFFVQVCSTEVMSSWLIDRGGWQDVAASAAVLTAAEHLRREAYE